MNTLLLIIQIISAVILSALVLLQVKGTGFGRVWGGLGGGNSFTRRGLEGVVFKFTFVVSAIFILVSVASLLLA